MGGIGTIAGHPRPCGCGKYTPLAASTTATTTSAGSRRAIPLTRVSYPRANVGPAHSLRLTSSLTKASPSPSMKSSSPSMNKEIPLIAKLQMLYVRIFEPVLELLSFGVRRYIFTFKVCIADVDGHVGKRIDRILKAYNPIFLSQEDYELMLLECAQLMLNYRDSWISTHSMVSSKYSKTLDALDRFLNYDDRSSGDIRCTEFFMQVCTDSGIYYENIHSREDFTSVLCELRAPDCTILSAGAKWRRVSMSKEKANKHQDHCHWSI